MINLIDYILDLFRDEGQAQAFVANPDQTLADAGLSTVSSAQLQSVVATAIPSLALGGGSGDPVTDLQQAVSSHYGFEPSYATQPDFSPSTDLASNNSFMSPTTNITDDHSVSFGMGDITLGDKTTAQ
ncbi:MAG TPA: IniB N-terminal domain-containing protein, partial [Mycobacterium sp.]